MIPVTPDNKPVEVARLNLVQNWFDEIKRLAPPSKQHVASGTAVTRLESLAGRFFLHRCPHWSWPECKAAFGWDLERWLFFGGYPGAAPWSTGPTNGRGISSTP